MGEGALELGGSEEGADVRRPHPLLPQHPLHCSSEHLCLLLGAAELNHLHRRTGARPRRLQRRRGVAAGLDAVGTQQGAAKGADGGGRPALIREE